MFKSTIRCQHVSSWVLQTEGLRIGIVLKIACNSWAWLAGFYRLPNAKLRELSATFWDDDDD